MSGWLTFTTGTPSQSWCYITENRMVNSAGTSSTWTGNNNIAITEGSWTNNHGVNVGYAGNGRYNTGGSCTSVCNSWDLPTNHFEIVSSNTFKIR